MPNNGDIIGVSGCGLDVVGDVQRVAASLMLWSVMALVGVE